MRMHVLLASLALVVGCASAPSNTNSALPVATPTTPATPTATGSWAANAEGQYRGMTYADGNRSLSVACSARCVTFIEFADSACEVGSSYPVLVNTATRIGVMAFTCVTLRGFGPVRTVLAAKEPDSMFLALGEPDTVHLAFPSQPGPILLLVVPTEGVQDFLSANVPATGKGTSPHERRTRGRQV